MAGADGAQGTIALLKLDIIVFYCLLRNFFCEMKTAPTEISSWGKGAYP